LSEPGFIGFIGLSGYLISGLQMGSASRRLLRRYAIRNDGSVTARFLLEGNAETIINDNE